MLGTAVNVQAWSSAISATAAHGRGLYPHPASGAKEFYGEFLMNAQGEDVSRHSDPVPILELQRSCERYDQLREITTAWKSIQDMQDLSSHSEGKLYMLQTRTQAHRTGGCASCHPDVG